MKPATTILGRVTGLLAALCSIALLAACATPLDRAWSLSKREHVARSIENPEAGKDKLEAPRPDGAATDSAMFKHREHERTLEQDEPESVINMQVGD
jgi:hypothetical protein